MFSKKNHELSIFFAILLFSGLLIPNAMFFYFSFALVHS